MDVDATETAELEEKGDAFDIVHLNGTQSPASSRIG
jgi:hypothetical protein